MHLHASSSAESVRALGELGLIEKIRGWLGNVTPPSPFGIGDDCAILPASRHPQLVTVDPVVYGQHFDDSVAPRAVAAKLLKRNLSDIAAMGGRPRAAVIALALDDKTSTRWLEQFYRGLAATAREFSVPIVGGDITRQTGGFSASLTLIGEADGPRALTRTGAKAGDWIYVTGTLGGSILGHHHKFTPRLPEGAWLARRREVRSMMDLSDGLAKDLHALTPRGAFASLDAKAIPASAAARTLARRDGKTALAHALSDGEDYELLFTVSAKSSANARTSAAAITAPGTIASATLNAFEKAWAKKFKTKLTRIGRFTTELDPAAIDLSEYHGYEHLR